MSVLPPRLPAHRGHTWAATGALQGAGAAGVKIALSPSRPAPRPRRARSIPRPRPAGWGAQKATGEALLPFPVHSILAGGVAPAPSAGPGCSRREGHDANGDRARLPGAAEAEGGSVTARMAVPNAVWLRWGGTGSGSPAPHRDSAGLGWSGWSQAKPRTEQVAAAYRLLPRPRRAAGLQQRHSGRPEVQPAARSPAQLFPAVLTARLRAARGVLTSSCALTKALYPQAKTSTLAIGKSDVTATTITLKTVLLLLLLRTRIKPPNSPDSDLNWPLGQEATFGIRAGCAFPKGLDSHIPSDSKLRQSPGLPPCPAPSTRAQHSARTAHTCEAQDGVAGAR